MELGLVIPELEGYYRRGAFYQTIESLQKAQVREIEPHGSFLLGKTPQKLAQLNQELSERSIIISSVHAPFGEGKDLASPNAIIRKITLNQHIAVMRRMAITKTKILTIHPGARPEKESEIPLREKIFKKSLEVLLKNAENSQIKLAVENMLPARPFEKIETIKEMLDEFPSPFLGVCFDTGHANVTEGISKIFNTIKDKIFDFHVHDNDGTKDMHLQPPYGNIDWAEFLALAGNINYQRPLMVESLPWQGRELSWMFKEIRMLKDKKILINPHTKDFGVGARPHYLKCAKCNHFIYGTQSNPICYCNSLV